MDNIFGSIESFIVASGLENVGARWQKWIRRFDNFLIAAGIVDDNRKEAMLLHCIGEETFDIFCSLPDPENPSQNPISKYDKAKLKLNNHFIPRVNEEFEIFNFRQAKQLVTETIDEYYARLLKLSANCHFPDRDREIKSQIIQCTTSSKLRRHAMAENWTLEQLLTKAKAFELTEDQAQKMETNTESTSRVYHKHFPQQKKKYNNTRQQNNQHCKNCGNLARQWTTIVSRSKHYMPFL